MHIKSKYKIGDRVAINVSKPGRFLPTCSKCGHRHRADPKDVPIIYKIYAIAYYESDLGIRIKYDLTVVRFAPRWLPKGECRRYDVGEDEILKKVASAELF